MLPVVQLFQPLPHDLRLRLQEIGNADHPVSLAFLGHRDKLPLSVDPNARFSVRRIGHHVPAVQLLPAKRVFRAPDVTGENVAVMDPIRRQRQTVQVVPLRILLVHKQFHAVLIHQVFKLILHEANHDRYLADPNGLQLGDEAVDQPLPVYLQQGLGRAEVDGYHAHAKPGGKNDRILRGLFL